MENWGLAAKFIGIGWYIGISIVGGILGGLWLDRKFGYSIIFTLVGLFLGLVVAAFGTYRMIVPLIKEQEDKSREDKQ
ncbi:MAG: AtpZ/AtpI family protein [Chloroflexi bacterium]|nr:AtpZ/AtpI family protein [Chloroflexota bacterium]